MLGQRFDANNSGDIRDYAREHGRSSTTAGRI
jgi:hypothetical protein